MKSVGTLSALSHDEHCALTRTMHAGRDAQALIDAPDGDGWNPELGEVAAEGLAARETLIARNTGLVPTFMRKMALGSQHQYDDHYQNGVIGIIRAVDTFDPDNGARFSTWAWYPVLEEVCGNVDQDLVRIPRFNQRAAMAVHTASDTFHETHQRRATPQELAQELDLSVASVTYALADFGMSPVVTDVFDDHDLIDRSVEDHFDENLLTSEVDRILSTLSADETRILRGMFGFDDGPKVSTADIATELGYPVDRVYHLRDRALSKLRHPATGAGLHLFIGQDIA